MKIFAKTVLIAVSLLLSAGLGFAADANDPVLDLKGNSEKADVKTSAVAGKEIEKGKATAAKASAKANKVDINTATDAELKDVPGIGEVCAAKIIAGRPYANKAQLKSRKIMSKIAYEQVKDLIIAKLPKK